MPRRKRFCPAGVPVHVIQRGNNRQICFGADEDIAAYAHWLAEGAEKFSVSIHGWVFMTNHVHLLITPEHNDSVSKLMQYLGRIYVRHFNYKYSRTGSLFEGRFKSSLVQEGRYFMDCLRYIELNPVRAGMVKDPGNYRWSSYSGHAFGRAIEMWQPHKDYLALGEFSETRQSSYRALIRDKLEHNVVEKIRHCANVGLVLGTEAFRDQCDELVGSM